MAKANLRIRHKTIRSYPFHPFRPFFNEIRSYPFHPFRPFFNQLTPVL
jgi:hypothetical protein